MIGAPNAGKSTLVNALVGQKVAIVSPKAQTTRARLMGIAIDGDDRRSCWSTRRASSSPDRRLDRAMVAAAWGGAEDADLIVLVIDAAARIERAGRATSLEGSSERQHPLWIVLNKVDSSRRTKLLGARRRS